MSRPTIQDTSVDHSADEAAIRQVIASVEAGFNAKDAALMNQPMSQNASVVNVHGMQFTGWDAIQDVSLRGLAGSLVDEYVRYSLIDLVFLRPDVAIAHKQAVATTAEGQVIEGEQTMIGLYVLVKEGGSWWVASRQNTLQHLPE